MSLIGNFLDRVKETTATTGTGTITLSGAVAPYQSFSGASAVTATVYWYLIEDGATAWEHGYGTYTSAGSSLTRTLVSSSTGSLLNLTGSATVAIVAPARSMNFLGARVVKASDQTTANYTTVAAVAWDSETFDVGGWHDTVTNNTRLTVPAGYGIKYVEVTGCIDTSLGTGDTSRTLYILKNGTTIVGIHTGTEGGFTTFGSVVASGPIAAAAGDYYELFFFQETDNSITVIAANSFLSVKVLG